MRTGRLVWGLAVLAMACGSDEDDSDIYADLPETKGAAQVSARVTTSGASLELDTGTRVRIPEGALKEPVDVEIRETRLADLPPKPRAGEQLEQPVAMTPHGTRFDKPVRVDLPITRGGGDLEARQVRVLKLDDDRDETWEPVSADLRLRKNDDGSQRAEFDIDSFSIYAVGVDATEAGDGGTGSEPAGDAAASDASSGMGGGPNTDAAPGIATVSYALEVVSVDDPCGHREFTTDPPPVIDIMNDGTTFVAMGDPPWVEINGDLLSAGAFQGTGSGTVAGVNDVSATMNGTFDAEGAFTADVSWGVAAELPGECPIVFMVQGTPR